MLFSIFREKKFLDSVSLVCDNHVNSDSPNQLIDEDGVDIIRNVSTSIQCISLSINSS